MGLSSHWDQYFQGEDGIHYVNALSLSLFPLWEIIKQSKTEEVCWVPYDNSFESEVEEKLLSFFKKYSPKKLFVPSWEACHKVSNKKYNDGGEVKHDFETPNDWNSGFKLQSFMTGPLTLREVWLPGRVTKMSNTYWFTLIEQIIGNVPYYANNYPDPKDLYNNIKDRLHGNAVLFDVTGFGLQFPRSLLMIAAKALMSIYHPSEYTNQRVDELDGILKEVWLEYPDGSFKKPLRGIGLGYYETLKTCVVLALLDHTNPISIYGDQGLIPFEIKKRKDHPRTILGKYGFLFTKPEKARILPNIESGVIWGGHFMSPSLFEERKSWSSKLAGALSGTYHWERKLALESIELPDEVKHIWKYLAFQYEIAFGFEFYRSEGLRHFQDLGVSPLGTPDVGNVRTLSVYKIKPPTDDFESSMTRSIFPTKTSIPRGMAKQFSIKRSKVYKKDIIMNTFLYDFSNPKVRLNETKDPRLTALARKTPFWLAVRELVLNGVDVGKISYGLKPHDLDRAIEKFPLAENPFEARATGGYTIQSFYTGYFGPTPEQSNLVDMLKQAYNDRIGSYIFRVDAPIDSSAYWSTEWVDKLPPDKYIIKNRMQNPYVRQFASNAVDFLIDSELPKLDSDYTDLLVALKSQLYKKRGDETDPESLSPNLLDAWEVFEETLPEEDFTKEDGDVLFTEDYSDLLCDEYHEEVSDEEYRPRSPDLIADEPTLTWNI